METPGSLRPVAAEPERAILVVNDWSGRVTEDEFWALIAEAQAEGTPALSDQPKILCTKLARLDPQDIIDFQVMFYTHHAEAYRWDLWAAAFIIEDGGCSEDGFADFRAGLIGLGKEVFFGALEHPDSLARLPPHGVDFSNEEFLGVAFDAYEAGTGLPLPDIDVPMPPKPVGVRWRDEDLPIRFPALCRAFSRR